MKWAEMNQKQRGLYVFSMILCGVLLAGIALSFSDVFLIPKYLLRGCLTVFWLCMGFLQKERKYAIMDFIFSGVYFVLFLLDVLR